LKIKQVWEDYAVISDCGKRYVYDFYGKGAHPVLSSGGSSGPPRSSQGDFEEDVVALLTMWCGAPPTWNTKKNVIEAFKTSHMWTSWI